MIREWREGEYEGKLEEEETENKRRSSSQNIINRRNKVRQLKKTEKK